MCALTSSAWCSFTSYPLAHSLYDPIHQGVQGLGLPVEHIELHCGPGLHTMRVPMSNDLCGEHVQWRMRVQWGMRGQCWHKSTHVVVSDPGDVWVVVRHVAIVPDGPPMGFRHLCVVCLVTLHVCHPVSKCVQVCKSWHPQQHSCIFLC